MTEAVRTSASDGVLVITIDRPKANAIDVATSQALHAAFDELRRDGSLRVGIVTGAGERFFSAGWDLKAAADGESVTADHGPGGFAGLTEFFDLDKPVIAAVNGLALGGGFELALAADLIVTADTAEFALPEVRLGFIPDSGGVLRLPRRLPRPVALELLMTGRRMDAAEALRWGLVNRICPPDELMTTALDLAAQIREAAPLAVAAVREVVSRTETLDPRAGFALLASGDLASYEAAIASEDAIEGPRAFAEKRPPRWKGR